MKIKQSVEDSGCSKTEINRDTKPELTAAFAVFDQLKISTTG